MEPPDYDEIPEATKPSGRQSKARIVRSVGRSLDDQTCAKTTYGRITAISPATRVFFLFLPYFSYCCITSRNINHIQYRRYSQSLTAWPGVLRVDAGRIAPRFVKQKIPLCRVILPLTIHEPMNGETRMQSRCGVAFSLVH